VDGGIRENLPVEVATRHLGVTHCYAVSSFPSGVPAEADFAGRDLSAIVLRATAGIMADEIQRQGVARARAAGATVIAPEVSVLGVLEVDPGLLAIAADYGYLRAAEACEHASVTEQQVVRELIELRRRIWASEGSLSRVGVGLPAARAELAPLKDRVRDLVGQVPPARLPEGASRWWQDWERHSQAVPQPFW
jgi:NTE family protein